MQPHRQQPTRLPRPWDSPGTNTGVGCHFLLQCMKVKSESEVTQSCPTLCNPMDYSLPGSSVHGIFQARVLEWGAIERKEKEKILTVFDWYAFLNISSSLPRRSTKNLTICAGRVRNLIYIQLNKFQFKISISASCIFAWKW